MKEKVQKQAQKSVFHGFLFGNGMFITPVEMRIMESLGVVPATRA